MQLKSCPAKKWRGIFDFDTVPYLLKSPHIASENAQKDIIMSVDEGTVRKIARLARIAIEDTKVAKMAGELNGILNWIEMLNEVDVEGVEPMASAVAIALPMRDDEITDGNIQASVLTNAPKADSGFFVVPKSVE